MRAHADEGTAPNGETIQIVDGHGARMKGKQIWEDGGTGGGGQPARNISLLILSVSIILLKTLIKLSLTLQNSQ